ncbi:MAG: hypothetical protein Q7R45_11730, partial [Sulfuricaulis sp.]|nr:hypothetical protein [Sulfuricaulis sp.]
MYAPTTHILALTVIQRERLLPVPGTVNVRAGQRVSATDVVAEARWAREHVLLDVARTLRISAAAADKLIQCKTGDELALNSLVASARGIFPREMRTPREGRVVVVGGGQILLEVGDVNIELRAGLPGLVTQVTPERGVMIRTAGSLIQGVWGNGRIETGLMISVMDKPDTILESSKLDVSQRGSVILGGACINPDALRAAAELPVRGLILSSLHTSLISLAQQMRFPIVAMEGIGTLPMNNPAYRLLSTNIKRELTVNAEAFDRYTGARPEVIIPLPITNEPPPPNNIDSFAPGQQVRLRAAPHYGTVVTLVTLR